jgi:uncharacterized SAM-binding protein YcdF (DUF218 family)
VTRILLRRILPLGVAALCLGAIPWILPAAGNFLVANEGPAQKADAVLVLAGDSFGRRIMKGAELVREGWAPVAYISGPDELYGLTEDQLAIQYAVKQGAKAEWFAGLPNQANSTEDEAQQLLPRLRGKGVRKLLLVTSDYHTRRALRIFRRMAETHAPGMQIHPVAARDALFDPNQWWKTRPGQKVFLLEWTKTLTEPFGI